MSVPDDAPAGHADLYAGWTPERWETPVSDAPVLFLVRLVDDGGTLEVTVEDARAGRHWRFTFADPPAYLNLLEEYRLGLWTRPGDRPALGSTVRVPHSPWLARLRAAEALLDVHAPGLHHFQIATESAVIDVLSQREPAILEVSASDAVRSDSRGDD